MIATSRFEREGLTVEVDRSVGKAAMSWIGESDSRSPSDFLNPIIKQLALELAGARITVDLTRLTYMNSATVAPLIACIKSFSGGANAVEVLFSDADWQRTHVQCLRTISRTLKNVHIDVRPAGNLVSHE